MNIGKFDDQLVVPLDHTWVTDYPNPGPPNGFSDPTPPNSNYWFCWGSFHSAGDEQQNPGPYRQFLGPVQADITEAMCICEANVQTNSDPSKASWSHAYLGDIYGQHGVCHQAANRILWAAGIPANGQRVTVEGVEGWNLSWWVYGPYGYKLTPDVWPLPQCSQKKPPATLEQIRQLTDPKLDRMIEKALGGDFDLGKKNAVQSIRAAMLESKKALDDHVTAGRIGRVQFAYEVNALAAEALRELASRPLNKHEFKSLFGFEYRSGMLPLIVDPEVAKVFALGEQEKKDTARGAGASN